MPYNTVDSDSAVDDRITITTDELNLPDDETKREAVHEKLRQAVHRAIEQETTNESASVSVTDGYEYASLPAECPDCGELPRILGLTVNPEDLNVANAKIECRSCGFSGGAKFRLVDLNTNKYNPEKMAEEYRSLVTDGDIAPDYYPY